MREITSYQAYALNRTTGQPEEAEIMEGVLSINRFKSNVVLFQDGSTQLTSNVELFYLPDMSFASDD